MHNFTHVKKNVHNQTDKPLEIGMMVNENFYDIPQEFKKKTGAGE